MAAGKNQREFAEDLDIDPSYLSHLEADRKEPSLSLLREIAAKASVPPGLLLAVVLVTELPPEQKELYGSLLDELLTISQLNQLKLDLE